MPVGLGDTLHSWSFLPSEAEYNREGSRSIGIGDWQSEGQKDKDYIDNNRNVHCLFSIYSGLHLTKYFMSIVSFNPQSNPARVGIITPEKHGDDMDRVRQLVMSELAAERRSVFLT